MPRVAASQTGLSGLTSTRYRRHNHRVIPGGWSRPTTRDHDPHVPRTLQFGMLYSTPLTHLGTSCGVLALIPSGSERVLHGIAVTTYSGEYRSARPPPLLLGIHKLRVHTYIVCMQCTEYSTYQYMPRCRQPTLKETRSLQSHIPHPTPPQLAPHPPPLTSPHFAHLLYDCVVCP